MAFYIKKTFVDVEPGIELVNIHYTWTPVGEMPSWEAHRETRMMPRGGVLVRGMGGTTVAESGEYVQTASERIELPDDSIRRKVIRLPKAIPNPASGGYTENYAFHHYFEIFRNGKREQSPLYTEEIVFFDNAPQARFAEYGCSEALVGFVAQELLPWVASQIPLAQRVGAHAVLGASLGRLAALWLGVRLPEIFGQVFSQAGGFALGFTKELGLITILRLSERLPLQIYIDCGRFDPLLEANRMTKGLLEARGYSLRYREFNAGHNYPAWREELATGLEWLFQSARAEAA